MTIGQRIKELRKHLKLTQAEFGEVIGLKATAIGMFEAEQRNVVDRNISLISEKFNVDEIWLRTGEGDMFIDLDRDEAIIQWAAKLTNNNSCSNEFAKRFALMLTQLDTAEWELLEKMARKLIDEKK